MINAIVNKGEVQCSIEGTGVQVLSEITILDKMADDKTEKDELVKVFCKGLNHINEGEN